MKRTTARCPLARLDTTSGSSLPLSFARRVVLHSLTRRVGDDLAYSDVQGFGQVRASIVGRGCAHVWPPDLDDECSCLNCGLSYSEWFI
jgi:hypothetical protein